MFAAHCMEAGGVFAVVTFFVLERTGLLYKWIEKIEKWGGDPPDSTGFYLTRSMPRSTTVLLPA